MPGRVGLAPWFVVLFWILRVGVPLMLLAMTIDTLRRPDSHFGRSWFGSRYGWVAQNLVLLVVMLLTLLGILQTLGTTASVIGLAFVPVTLAHIVRYLLTVVFPSPKRLAEREARDVDDSR